MDKILHISLMIDDMIFFYHSDDSRAINDIEIELFKMFSDSEIDR